MTDKKRRERVTTQESNCPVCGRRGMLNIGSCTQSFSPLAGDIVLSREELRAAFDKFGIVLKEQLIAEIFGKAET
jgi:hypothetical protein